MTSPKDKDRPEAGRDTESGKQGEGAHARDGDSGGSRTKAGGTYGDWVPDRGQPMKNNDRDATPPMGDYYTGGGNIDRLAKEPGSAAAGGGDAARPQATDDQGKATSGQVPEEQSDEERVAEANRNIGFDTTHVHSSATSRKV